MVSLKFPVSTVSAMGCNALPENTVRVTDRIKYGLSPLWAETHSLYETKGRTVLRRHGSSTGFRSRGRTCIYWLNMHLKYSTVVPDIYSWEFNWCKDNALVNRALYSAVHRGK
jgi:hypothetical protein